MEILKNKSSRLPEISDMLFPHISQRVKLCGDLIKLYSPEKQIPRSDLQSITITVSSKKTRQIYLTDISYISHEQNYTYFHLVSGERLSQYISLTKVESTLPDNLCVRISKSYIVMLPQVYDYDNYGVTLKSVLDRKPVTLPLSRKNKVPILLRLENHIREFWAWEREIEEKIKLKAITKKVLLFIQEHPGAKNSAIAEAVHRSPKTIPTHIRKLTELELICFKGCPKYGGYYAMDKK